MGRIWFDGMTGQIQVTDYQCFQKDRSTGAIGQCVEKIDRNPAVCVADREQVTIVLPWQQGAQGLAHIFLNPGRMWVGFEIIPEQAPAQPDGKKGQTFQSLVEGLL